MFKENFLIVCEALSAIVPQGPPHAYFSLFSRTFFGSMARACIHLLIFHLLSEVLGGCGHLGHPRVDGRPEKMDFEITAVVTAAAARPK